MNRWPASVIEARIVDRIEPLVGRGITLVRTHRAVSVFAGFIVFGALGMAAIGAGSVTGPDQAGVNPPPGVLGSVSSASQNPDLVGFGAKGVIVVALLLITLRVLRHAQQGGRPASARLILLESRPLGPKATLYLVAVGDRRLVVGLTPSGLVPLAELGVEELPDALIQPGTALPGPATADPATRGSFADTLAPLSGLNGSAR